MNTLSKFLKDAKNFYNKKDDSEIICKILKGGYWLKKPGSNPEIILAYQGVIATEIIEATTILGEKFRDIGVLAITSSDRMLDDWKNKQLSSNQNKNESHVESLLKVIPRDTKILI